MWGIYELISISFQRNTEKTKKDKKKIINAITVSNSFIQINTCDTSRPPYSLAGDVFEFGALEEGVVLQSA
jgi:hypothetical protein